MRKILNIVMLLVLILASTPSSLAKDQERTVEIHGASPEHPVVYLGKSIDKKTGEEVEGYAIVHFAKNSNSAKPAPSGSTCYGFLANGAKWKTNEPWVIDSVNTAGIDPNLLLNNVTADIAKWEDAADGTVGNGQGVDILGNGSLSTGSLSSNAQYDGYNQIIFAPISDTNTIAVTYVWGHFSGPASKRDLIEWDQVYNTYYSWSMSGAMDKMDFENIATHELGHVVGLGDLYTSDCAAQTMYGYSNNGDTSKRDLNTGDIAGVNLLY